MMEDNKHLAQRIDGAIRSAGQEVTNLRSELSATSRRLAEMGANSPPALENNHHHQHHLHQHHQQQQLGAEGLQSVGLLHASSSDPNIYLPGNHVLTGQFDPSLLQQGLVGQASMSGRLRIRLTITARDLFVLTQ